MNTLTFELVRSTIQSLKRPDVPHARATYWLVERCLGIALTSNGRIEIFLAGRVTASLPTVRRHLEVGDWQATSAEDTFTASRVVLPEGDYFEPIAAVIGVELLRGGDLTRPGALQNAFDSVEPILDLALRNQALAEDSIVGLLGELLALEQLLNAAKLAGIPGARVVGAWRGYERGSRDFVIGHSAIEVKTTRGGVSRHRVSHLGQIEAKQLPDGSQERLWLLSIGLVECEGGGQSVSDAANRLFALLSAESDMPVRDILFRNVARYGIGLEAGFQYEAMRNWPAFRKQFEVSFTPRLYDLCDPDVKLLQSRDLIGTHVDVTDVEYAFTLPDRINDLNPERGWQRKLLDMLQADGHVSLHDDMPNFN